MKAIWIGLVGVMLFACSDLPDLGVCGNGIVERTAGEDCEGTEAEHCSGCRRMCSLTLTFAGPADTEGTCEVDGECCPADERCGVDSLCYRPSGLFATPRGILAFPATQATIADVDGDSIGDAFGVAGDQVSFRFGDANGDLTRSGTTRIPPLSRPDSHVVFLDVSTDLRPTGSPTASVVSPTEIGFALLVAIDNQLSSPPLPELAFDNPMSPDPYLPNVPNAFVIDAGYGDATDLGLAAAPSALGDVVAIVAERRSDPGPMAPAQPPAPAPKLDRVTVRVFRDRNPRATDTSPCGSANIALPDPTTSTKIIANLRLAPGGADEADGRVEEYAFVAVAKVTPASTAGPLAVEAAHLCLYQTKYGPRVEPPPIPDFASLDDETVITLPASSYVSRLRPAELDTDDCPELVFETTQTDGTAHVFVVDTAPGPTTPVSARTTCIPKPTIHEIAAGHLRGVGNLGVFDAGDAGDEILIDRGVFTGPLLAVAPFMTRVEIGPQDPGAFLELPDALDEAIVVDINRDGLADIVATGASAADLTVILQTPFGFAPRSVPSSGPLHDLITADFDADTFPDVAAIELRTGRDARLLVAFGGLHGPEQLETLGEMHEPRSLTAFRDRTPDSADDPFGDLMFIHSPLTEDQFGGGRTYQDELTQFSGSGNRAITSQINLSGAPLNETNTFGRTMVSGYLVSPFTNGLDFCAINFGPLGAAPNGGTLTSALCVGGQGAQLSGGPLFVDSPGQPMGIPPNDDPTDKTLPIFVAANVGSRTPEEPYPVLIGMNTNNTTKQLIVLAPPPALYAPPPQPVQVISEVITLNFPPPIPATATTTITNIRVVELDDDPDSELIISVKASDGVTFRYYLVRVDLSESGRAVSAKADYLLPSTFGDCTDAAEAELGEVQPDGKPAIPRAAELVVLCYERNPEANPLDMPALGVGKLFALYRTPGAMPNQQRVPWPVGVVGNTNGRVGRIVVGDMTGDHLDDLLIISDSANDAVAVAVIQCPEHDRTRCQRMPLIGTGMK